MTLSDEALELIELALILDPEGEGLELGDREYELEHIVALKIRLSAWRHAIDAVNNALAQLWKDDHPGQRYDDTSSSWYLGKTKGKKAINKRLFYEWLATKDAAELSTLVADYNIKTGGMTQAERETFLDESSTNDRVKIQQKLK